jgi:hypothetical protein
MSGHVGGVLRTCGAVRYSQSGARGADGKWVAGAEVSTIHKDVNLQPVSEKELANLGIGAERIEDYRKAYINDGLTADLTPQDEWEFDAPGLVGVRFTMDSTDNRPWNNYCKIVVHRNDR